MIRPTRENAFSAGPISIVGRSARMEDETHLLNALGEIHCSLFCAGLTKWSYLVYVAYYLKLGTWLLASAGNLDMYIRSHSKVGHYFKPLRNVDHHFKVAEA